MNGRAAVAVTGLLLAGCATESGSAASCAAPIVRVTPAAFAPGDEVRVSGGGFFDDCYDTGQPGTPPATQDIEVRLLTTGDPAETFVLATVDADEDGGIEARSRTPDDVPPGPARIGAAFGEPAQVVVTSP
jgi:hypothetical protein